MKIMTSTNVKGETIEVAKVTDYGHLMVKGLNNVLVIPNYRETDFMADLDTLKEERVMEVFRTVEEDDAHHEFYVQFKGCRSFVSIDVVHPILGELVHVEFEELV